MRVVVAMSGGVDSSVAAALMKEAGHDVIGLAMKTHSLAPKANRACCTPDDMRDARLIADQLEIPFLCCLMNKSLSMRLLRLLPKPTVTATPQIHV